MTTQSDQLLCDYIFGLLEEAQEKAIEQEIKNSDSLARRFKELNEIFCGLDTVKEDYPSPVSRIMDKLCRLSCAGVAMASALTIFWATVFGGVNGELRESSYHSSGTDLKKSAISCISGIASSEESSYQFSDLSYYRE